MADPLADNNIRLRLVTPDYECETQAPAQIMEADNDEDETQELHHQVEIKYTIPDPELEDGLSRAEPDEILPLSENQEDEESMVIEEGSEEEEEEVLSELDDPKDPPSGDEGEVSDGEVMGTDDRVTVLEIELKRSKGRLDGFSQELKLLLAEVNIVCDWITDNFGVELIDKASQLFKHIHDYGEVEEICDNLSLLRKGKQNVRRSTRRKPTKPRKKAPLLPKKKRGRGRPKKNQTESEESYNEEPADPFFDPPECVLNTDVEEEFFKAEAKPKRKRVRKRTPKKVVTEEGGEDIKEELAEVELGEDGKPKKRKKWKAPQRSLQCEECGKILKADSSLRWHMLMHADLRPVECTEPGCGKSFRDKSKLAQHTKIHSGEKSEKCRYCDRGFLRKKDLIVHERTHTGEKPFSCPNCPKTFNIKDHLTIHLRVHTGERPYKCPTCDKAFSQANSLRIHKKIHLKQAGDHVPAPRKPRAPRKNKPVISILLHEPLPSPSSVSAQHSGLDLEEPKAINLHLQDDGMEPPSPGPAETHSALVQSFFQAQTLNSVPQLGQGLLDPVQQAWSFVAATNPGSAADHHHQQQVQLQHQHQQQRGFGSLGHLGVVIPTHAGGGFKIQQAYHPHAQQHQQQQQQQQAQNLNLIRNPNPLPGQGGPFVPSQFHDPNFRHFPN